MLKHLKIRNFAIIDEVEIEFDEGLNIISGETGAGKSILMDALLLILGGRSSTDLIRSGTDEASVEALFQIDGDGEILKSLRDQGFPIDKEELIVRRIVNASGKSRIFLNGSMANMHTLQSITSHLVDLCSQHDQQLLAQAEEQLFWIDRFGGFESEREKMRELYEDWKSKKIKVQELTTDSSQREQRIDFLKFQIQELTEAQLNDPEEDKILESELRVLANRESLFSFTSEMQSALEGEASLNEIGLLRQVNSLAHKAKQLADLDRELHTALHLLESLKIHADELSIFSRAYSNKVPRDEEKIEGLNSRLAYLSKIKKKYGPNLADSIECLTALQEELSRLENHASSLEEASSNLAIAWNAYSKYANSLSQLREKSAKKFAQSVARELTELNMQGVRFEVSFSQLQEPSQWGQDCVKFLIAANPGEPMGALNKVASGGELSRVMLAMHNVVSSKSGVGVYLFDEVDAGIGGQTAVSVGAKLQRVSQNNQVICITHLPQVAAFADVHFYVQKRVNAKHGVERTTVSVIKLPNGEREGEIARMLGGIGHEKAARANARAMIESARKEKRAPKETRI